MSSPSRSWSSHRAAVLLALVLAALALPAAAPAAADAPLPIDAVLTAGGRTTLVADLSAARAGNRSVAVTDGTSALPATLVPVLSPDAAITLVVDTSAAGAATLPAWSSAAARFSLEAPLTAHGVVITASRPAAVLGGPQRGPVEIVRALTGLHPGGERDTAAALNLAVRQFPAVPPGRRVVVLYTSAPDAGGPAAADLGRTFSEAGAILVVAATAGSGYWSAAAGATGGFFAPAADPVVVPALDQVQTTLAGRFLVQLDAPARPGARLAVRVTTTDGRFTGTAAVPGAAPSAGAIAGRGDHGVWWWAAALLAVAIGGFVVVRRRRPVPPGDAAAALAAAPAIPADAGPDAPSAGAAPTPAANATPAPAAPGGATPASTGVIHTSAAGAVARGRAFVPGAIIRGRAAVPPPDPRTTAHQPRATADRPDQPRPTPGRPDPEATGRPDPGPAG